MNRVLGAAPAPPTGVLDLLQPLALDGWRFWLEEGRLRYRAPKTAATAATLEQLKQHRAAVIDLLTVAPDSLDICPLAYGQAALWFLWKLAPASHAYNQSLPLRIDGAGANGDAERWRAACETLAARHPMLRTIFPARQGQPYQQVLAAPALAWQATAPGAEGAGWDGDRVAAALAAAHAAPFHLEDAPPLRCHWFADAAGPGQHILLITLHHIACDGWSLELMRRELNALVTAGADTRSLAPALAPAPAPAFTYHDYVRWQQALLHGAEGERLWTYWRDQLAGPLPLLNLPIDHPRPPVQRYEGASCPLELPPALGPQLQALAQSAGATLFELLLAAYVVLLYRFTGQDDLLIGVPNAGRSRPEFGAIVGYFVNPFVLRATLDTSMTFRQLLAAVRDRARQAIAHAEFPFPLLVQRLQPERSPDRSPLFDVSMNYHTRRSAPGEEGARAPAQMVELPQADGKFDLTLTMVEEDGRLHGALGYNLALFDAATVAGWAGCLGTLLHGIVASPDAALEALPLHRGVSAPALRGPRRAVTAAQMLHVRVAAQAAQRPAAPAVADDRTTLTYAELDRRATALAGVLAGLGAGLDDRVAICTGRSVDFCVAMLAALKAGAAYVPLEPGQPAELLEYMIRHAGAVALLTQTALLPALPAVTCPVICVDAEPTPCLPGADNDESRGLASPLAPRPSRFSEQGAAADGTTIAPLATAGLDNLAYVMYTSGSTGRPKAVAIEHGALANYTASMIHDLAIDRPYNFLLASTVAADLGNTVIFPALCTGGCLHILPETARLDPKQFATLMAERAIDYLKIVPSHLAALLGDGAAIHASGLPRRALVLGGEGAAPAWVARLQATAPNCRIYNHYGPTETTVGVLTHRCDPADPPVASATLPLSRAVANTDIYLLDANQQATPPGAVSELYVGGAALARGYLGDTGQAGAGFVTMADADGRAARRLYRTGDLARQRANGALEVLGRRDRQIKLRGYRIELAQIENVLRQAPGVDQAVVITDRDGAQATALLAFVVSRAAPHGEDARLPRIQRHLADHLPRYMTPTSVTLVAHIPVTANGKLDIAALRRLEATPATTPTGMLPRDGVELQLSRLWAEILARPQVGIHDNFFELGGHSLLAVRLAAQIEATFGIWVPLAALLTHPTIASLAQVLRQEGRGLTGQASPDPLLAPLSQPAAGPPIVLLPGAGGSVMYFADLAQRLSAPSGAPRRAVWGMQAIGLNPGAAIPQSIAAIAAHYVDVLRRAFPAAGRYYLIGHSFGALIGLEMARQIYTVQPPGSASPVMLCVLDNPAPQPAAIPDDAGYDHGDWLMHVATRIGKLNGVGLEMARSDLDGLTVAEQNALLVDRLLHQGLLPAGVSAAYFNRFIDVYRANARAAAEYQPRGAAPPLDLLLVRAREGDADLGAQDLSRRQDQADPTWGWQAYTAGVVNTVTVPGTHLSIFAPPAVASLATVLDNWIEEKGRE